MTWTPTPTQPAAVGMLGWSPDGPPAPTPPDQQGWWIVPQTVATDKGIGTDHTTMLTQLSIHDLGISIDAATLALTSPLRGTTHTVGVDSAGTLARITSRDHATAAATATLGLSTRSGGHGRDHAQLAAHMMSGIVLAHGLDRTNTMTIQLLGRTLNDGRDRVVGSFTPHAPVAVTVTTSTTIPIPPWCRYIDTVTLGGGGGGAGGTQGVPGWDGNGGKSGTYAHQRWDRGATGNLWADLTATIGGGGNGGAAKKAGTAGGTTTITIHSTSNTISSAGGAGGSGETLGGGVSGAQNGKAPGDHTFQGITATGGGENSGVPGAGGKGGGGVWWPASPGGGTTGARGQAWIIFSQ